MLATRWMPMRSAATRNASAWRLYSRAGSDGIRILLAHGPDEDLE